MPKSSKLLPVATVVLGALFLFCACNKNQSVPLTPPVEPQFTMNPGPSFPAFAVHILEREYEHQESLGNQRAMSMTLEEYLESRLQELYPDVAYEGMLDQTSALYEQFVGEYEQYMEQEALYEASIGLEPEPEEEPVPFTTLEDEIEQTDMSQEDIDLFLALEDIAQSDPPVDSETLENLLNADGGRLGQRIIPLFAVYYMSAVMPYAAFRIYLGHSHANQRATEYYGAHGADAGKRGDAFKHIFMSMYLRRYIGRPHAALAMYLNEARRDLDGSNNPPNREMDFHNNYIGMKSKYGHFRGHWLWDRYNWGTWGRRVRNYVNKHSNGVKMEAWDDDIGEIYPTSNYVARNQADVVSSKKYIWFEEND
jgi:hypothetical protein